MPWDASGVDEIVHKSDDPVADACKVSQIILKFWRLYASLPPATPPECHREGGMLWIDTVVRLNGGIGILASAISGKQNSAKKTNYERHADAPWRGSMGRSFASSLM